ncbi:MAG: transcriptional repressor NrdR [Chloroflexi bacterium]|nr:transcriptional repressor NrdR [Chloroflexota bacterium]
MHCPHCGHDDSKVIDSRDSGDGIRRRRECLKCERRFTTYERVQTRSLMVTKRDGRREEFQRDKLWASLTKACAKRPLPTGSIEKLAQDVETVLVETGRAEVPAETIGEMVMQKLKDLDRVAYIRYASVYRDFKDIETFKVAIDSLLEPPEPASEPSTQLSFLEEAALPVPRRRRGRPPKRPLAGSR